LKQIQDKIGNLEFNKLDAACTSAAALMSEQVKPFGDAIEQATESLRVVKVVKDAAEAKLD